MEMVVAGVNKVKFDGEVNLIGSLSYFTNWRESFMFIFHKYSSVRIDL